MLLTLLIKRIIMSQELKPSQLYYKKSIITGAIVFISVLLGISIFSFMIGTKEGLETGKLIFIVGGIAWTILVAVILFFEKLRIDNLSYIIKDRRVTIFKGIFTKVEKDIPYTKVTDFVLHRTLLDRYLGIGSILIQTAGQSQSPTGYEGNLDGLYDFTDIHQQLKSKLLEAESGPEIKNVSDEKSSSESLLKEILNELKAINSNFNK